MSRTVLVAGPPCAGKSTYVRNHAAPGDDVVDYDVIAATGTAKPWDEWAKRVDAPLEEGRTRWVIWTAPMRSQRGRFRSMYGAEVVVVWAPMDVCLARARDERPAMWSAYYIPGWFAAWEPSRSRQERVVRGSNPYKDNLYAGAAGEYEGGGSNLAAPVT